MRLAEIVAIGLLLLHSTGQACDMARVATAGDGTPIMGSSRGEPALFFRANLDVNTDGAARSYHPSDPRGRTMALNNMANAMTGIFAADGRDISCAPVRGECFTRYMTVFEESRDAGWSRAGHRYFTTRNIIPWRQDPRSGRLVPCTIERGAYAGYFVSMTSRKVDDNRSDCDQDAWIDSLTYSAIVLPRGARWSAQQHVAAEFAVAAVRNRSNGLVRFAIVGDRGPAKSLGEGSVALAAALRDVPVAPDATYLTIRALALPSVDYVVFPAINAKTAVGGPLTQAKIDRLGREAFARWGGVTRLDACAP